MPQMTSEQQPLANNSHYLKAKIEPFAQKFDIIDLHGRCKQN